MENSFCRMQRNQARAWFNFIDALFEVVIEHVHPGNLGDLPPSPRVLLSKGWLLGLTDTQEIANRERGLSSQISPWRF